MRTTARVIERDGNFATVEVERASACEGCHKSVEGGCSVCDLANRHTKKTLARAENSIGAEVGDTVIAEAATGRMLLYAGLIFLFPLLLLFAGYVIASAFSENLTIRLIGAGIGFVISFASVAVFSRTVGKRTCDIRITGILKK